MEPMRQKTNGLQVAGLPYGVVAGAAAVAGLL